MNVHQDDPLSHHGKKKDNIMFRNIYIGRQKASG